MGGLIASLVNRAETSIKLKNKYIELELRSGEVAATNKEVIRTLKCSTEKKKHKTF